jgi:hypothetical protein
VFASTSIATKGFSLFYYTSGPTTPLNAAGLLVIVFSVVAPFFAASALQNGGNPNF